MALMGLAEKCADPLMKACDEHVLPRFKNFIIYHLKRLGWIADNHMIPARDLILHDRSNTHWVYEICAHDTRLKEAAGLNHGTQSFEIKAEKNFDLLLPDKTYGVYLIFRTPLGPGFNAVLTATVSTETDESKDVCLTKDPNVNADQKLDDIKLPVNSSYVGWMELELGEFSRSTNAAKQVAEISIKVKENSKHKMTAGVNVAGIELRSKP